MAESNMNSKNITEKNSNEQSNLTFSAKLKNSILDSLMLFDNHSQISFIAFCSVSFKSLRKTLSFKTHSERIVNYFQKNLRSEYNGQAKIIQHKELITCSIEDQRLAAEIVESIDEFFHYNPANLAEYYSVEDYYSVVQAILRGLFLGCGFLANPQERYHLEFNIPRRSASLWYGLFLSELNLEPGRTVHQGSEVLYLKDGELISDFLRYVGASQIMLRFEEIRVEKDMRNYVNRLVNCDSANAQRLANSVARQINNINYLKEQIDWAELPEELVEAAVLRLEHPTFSLRELGEIATPPVGKSGMNHRLSKLDDLANKLRLEKSNQKE